MKAPIAEMYSSVQGEGVWTGTPMKFVRLAGCTVGRHLLGAPKLVTGRSAWQCHTYDNRSFWCDTDFNKYHEVEVENLFAIMNERTMCLTGGEPLMHRMVVLDILRFANLCNKVVHIETSGTIAFDTRGELRRFYPWITVAPKLGVLDEMIERANEIKLLVDENFDLAKVPDIILNHEDVFVTPVNGEKDVNQANTKLCLDILKQKPNWRLSVQLHKYLGVR